MRKVIGRICEAPSSATESLAIVQGVKNSSEARIGANVCLFEVFYAGTHIIFDGWLTVIDLRYADSATCKQARMHSIRYVCNCV